ncbi:hypothetical protein JYU34_007921 [Plutella xylostella]|uniref:Uncharacterized protein n=1 Tax=Plutella xylostella TaxID=51655 RepID=A0ABQ7QND8_PLUXY|nr:hypothetical protein JYU34_007921 [Plutella xylostella]
MQRPPRSPGDVTDTEPPARSRPTSRRNSDSATSMSRKNSAMKDSARSKTSTKSPAQSLVSTPKRCVPRVDKPEFMVTGKQLLKKYDRANSLPGGRRQSAGSLGARVQESPRSRVPESPRSRVQESPRRTITPHSSKSRDTSLEDDMSLDFSQDTNCKYGVKKKFPGIATSTPKSTPKPSQKPRSGSLQSQRYSPKVLEAQKKSQQSFDSAKHTFSHSVSNSTMSFSRDSKTSSASNYRYARSTELDYSSVSPEYSSAELSPRDVAVVSPFSRESYMSWVDSDMEKTKIEDHKARHTENGEWNSFWANYNNSVSRVPMKNYYDQCPTPYRTENIDLADLDFSAEGSRKRSPEDLRNINNIIRNEGLHLTPRETQNIIKCAHILGNVLTKAIDRSAKKVELGEEKITEFKSQNEIKIDPEVEIKKKALTLELKEQNKPLIVEEEKKCETVTTQTDISLPNTKSAPKIFEKILRQLSRSSIDEGILAKKREEEDNKTVQDVKDNADCNETKT